MNSTPPLVAWSLFSAYALVWALAFISAVVTVRTPPGHIPLWLYSREPGDQAYFHNVLQAVEKKLDGTLRFCRKCGAFKPDLAHHSRELGVCILCYQHWDVWSNNGTHTTCRKTFCLLPPPRACAGRDLILTVRAPRATPRLVVSALSHRLLQPQGLPARPRLWRPRPRCLARPRPPGTLPLV
jgi:hypothetical protein